MESWNESVQLRRVEQFTIEVRKKQRGFFFISVTHCNLVLKGPIQIKIIIAFMFCLQDLRFTEGLTPCSQIVLSDHFLLHVRSQFVPNK